jgi:hypothetical protein
MKRYKLQLRKRGIFSGGLIAWKAELLDETGRVAVRRTGPTWEAAARRALVWADDVDAQDGFPGFEVEGPDGEKVTGKQMRQAR